MKLYQIFLLGAIAFLSLNSCGSKLPDGQDNLEIYLVRHAEKVLDMRDPGLTKEGRDRAYFLVEYLKEEKIDAIYSTDYFRTRKTAQPLASATQLDIQIYDPSDLTAFAEMIRKKHKTGTLLIVGHSNTTAVLTNAFIGKEQYEDLEEWQYDQIYKVIISRKGEIESNKSQFGRVSKLKEAQQ